MKATIGLIMMLLAAAAHGQLLKCISKDGKIEYANQCPPGTREQATGIKNSPSSTPTGSTASRKPLAEQDAEFRKRQVEKQEAQAKEEKKLAEAERRSRACEDARTYLKGLESGARIPRVDPNTGERVYLEDAERAQEIQKAQRIIETNCK